MTMSHRPATSVTYDILPHKYHLSHSWRMEYRYDVQSYANNKIGPLQLFLFVEHCCCFLISFCFRFFVMGNVLSDEEDEQQFLEDGFNLESPDADKVINYGTAAPVWQNKAPSDRNMNDSNGPPPNSREDLASAGANEGQEGASHPRRSNSTTSSEDQAPPKKLSYIQMAKLGYQELVNAIIRPPRADYKVTLSLLCFILFVNRYLIYSKTDGIFGTAGI